MSTDRIAVYRDFLPDVDADLQRAFPFTVEKVARSGKEDFPGTYFIDGLASVYNKWSLDLGGFRERVKPGAFDEVLKTDPHVLHVWDHDTSKVLSSTQNGTLEIKSVDQGLHYYSKVAPTTYAQDLEILLRRGDINQSSFAFTVEQDEWKIKEDNGEEIVERTIVKVGGLYDVTTCAMGAYPQTDAVLAVRTLGSKRTSVVIPSFWSLDSQQSAAAAGTTNVFVRNVSNDTPENVAPEAGESQEDVAPKVGDPETPEVKGEPDQQPDAEVAPERKRPEDAEAHEREFDLWRRKRLSEHRRTREFVYGVTPKKEDEK